MSGRAEVEALFEKVGLVYRAVRPKSSVPIPFRGEPFELVPPTHVLRVIDTTGQEEEWEVDIYVADDAEAKRRARQLSDWIYEPARVRAYRFGETEASLIGIRGARSR